MKPLTANDLVVGGKYVPHSKSINSAYSLEHVLRKMKELNTPYLIYTNEPYPESYRFSLGKDWFWFNPSEVTPYYEPNQTTMNTDYTEQPFNLETALKHPELVRTRDGKEIDFIKEYVNRDKRYPITAIDSNGERNYYTRDGKWRINDETRHDLILRVPYREIFVSIYPNGDAKWDEVNQPRKDCLICVPVKIPAI